jgi:hypothetical protein
MKSTVAALPELSASVDVLGTWRRPGVVAVVPFGRVGPRACAESRGYSRHSFCGSGRGEARVGGAAAGAGPEAAIVSARTQTETEDLPQIRFIRFDTTPVRSEAKRYGLE